MDIFIYHFKKRVKGRTYKRQAVFRSRGEARRTGTRPSLQEASPGLGRGAVQARGQGFSLVQIGPEEAPSLRSRQGMAGGFIARLERILQGKVGMGHRIAPVDPRARPKIETVERQELAAATGHEVDGFDEVAGVRVVHRKVETDPAPAGLDPAKALPDGRPVSFGGRLVDPQELMTVGAGARAPGPRLNAEEVVEKDGHEFRMEIAAALAPDVERDDADAPGRIGIAHDLEARLGPPFREGPPEQLLFPALDRFDRHGLLDHEGQRGLDGLKDSGRPGLLPLLDVVEEVMAVPANVGDGPAAARRRRQVLAIDPLVEDQDAARTGPAEELVGGDEHGVETGVLARRSGRRVHVDADIGGAGRIIEAGHRPVTVEHRGQLADGRDEARDIGGRRERADAHSAEISRVPQQLFEVGQVDAAVPAQAHDDDRARSFAPGQLVGVMLIGADEDHRPVGFDESFEIGGPLRPGMLADEREEHLPGRRRQSCADDPLEAVDGRRAAESDADDPSLRPSIDGLLDGPLGAVENAGHAPAGDVVLGMRIRIVALEAKEIGLDEAERSSGGRVVAIDHQAFAERGRYGGVDADDLVPQRCGVEKRIRHGGPPVLRAKTDSRSPSW
ncbi:MAG: hypothetical protein MZV63_65835 [Marinilabiliales bacterium]|nr:hypothetical protein [Marinilabiliales bacterium]